MSNLQRLFPVEVELLPWEPGKQIQRFFVHAANIAAPIPTLHDFPPELAMLKVYVIQLLLHRLFSPVDPSPVEPVD